MVKHFSVGAERGGKEDKEGFWHSCFGSPQRHTISRGLQLRSFTLDPYPITPLAKLNLLLVAAPPRPQKVYDPSTAMWALTKSPMVVGVSFAAAGVVSGKLFVAGGNAGFTKGGVTATCQCFDPATQVGLGGAQRSAAQRRRVKRVDPGAGSALTCMPWPRRPLACPGWCRSGLGARTCRPLGPKPQALSFAGGCLWWEG